MTITFGAFGDFALVVIWSIGVLLIGLLLGIVVMTRIYKEKVAEWLDRLQDYDAMCDGYLSQLEEARDNGFVSELDEE